MLIIILFLSVSSFRSVKMEEKEKSFMIKGLQKNLPDGKIDLENVKKFILSKLKDGLDPKYTYHCVDHTIDVYNACDLYAKMEKIGPKERILLLTAALYHDSGVLKVWVGHEEASVELAKETLPGFGYSEEDIKIISGLIRATKLPQNPLTHLEKIICDADLDYLGRDDFSMIAMRLQHEWNVTGFKKTTLKEWYELQIRFLSNHKYFTESANNMRNEKKQQNLNEIKEMLIVNKY